ncbi:polysaccharide biosynthesis protein [Mesohalobacter halotolerans]|uniref:Polysaccharide biosynthesis protein n=1 Tax=Mesohalobacter halotolerans TaxID=1883405 RepID=A0A4U5TT73_9FLAO|nr:nucleoside-diphosphate sugar epimerase/dehydratase [Mesohalobacter halotolerans]TKS57559.1 polysaccharide biosynthesis protein [Mesohalobacter halotolerans]
MNTIIKYLFHKLKKLSKYHVPRILILWIDTVLSFLALLLTFTLINSSTISYFEIDDNYWINFGIIFIIQFLSIVLFKSYLGIIRYTNLKDAFKQIQSILFTIIVIYTINIVCDFLGISRIFTNSGVIVYGFIAFTFLFFYRIIIKEIYQAIHTTSASKYVYVLGTSLTDVAVAESINNDVQTEYQLAGFISESKSLNKKRILNLPIISLSEVESSETHNTVIVTVDKIKRLRKNESKILNILLDKNFNIYKLPEIENWDEKSILSNIKKVKLEDLLQRTPIKLNWSKLKGIYNNKVILVTGAAGSIGSDIVKQLTYFEPKTIIMLDNAETPLHDMSLYMSQKHNDIHFEAIIADVRNLKRLQEIFDVFKPEIVFHGAAYKHVPMMENNPVEALDVNFCGTKHLADLAVRHKVDRFVFISTDKAINPTNVMGASKRAAELYLQCKARKNKDQTTFITTRFGNVLGSNGSVIPYFKKQIEQRQALTVTHPEITRYFMTIDEACQLVIEAGAMGKGGEIYVFDMGKPVKILELAKNLIRLSGLTPNVDIDIKFVGLRPGEKLYEELLADKENTLPTHHQKILIAKASYDFDNTKIKLLNDLIYFIQENNQNNSLKGLKLLVPEYKSTSLSKKDKKNGTHIS